LTEGTPNGPVLLSLAKKSAVDRIEREKAAKEEKRNLGARYRGYSKPVRNSGARKGDGGRKLALNNTWKEGSVLTGEGTDCKISADRLGVGRLKTAGEKVRGS